MEARPEPSLTHRAFSGALWTASGWGLSAVFQLAFGIALARLLGPEILGVYAAALVVIRFSDVFANIGIGPALVQRGALERRHLTTGVTLAVGLSFAIAAVTWFGAPAISRFYRMPEVERAVRLLTLVFPLRGLAVVPQALLQRSLRFRDLAAIEASTYVFGFGIVGVSLAFAGYGLDALIIATISQAFLHLALLSWIQSFPLVPSVKWSAVRELLSFGGGITLVSIFGFLAFQADKLIVGRFLGAASLGLYSRAYSLFSTSTRLYQKIASTAFFPLLSRVQDDRERLGRGFRRGLALNVMTVLPMSAVLFVIAPDLIPALLGSAWQGVVTPFRVLILLAFLRGIAKLCGPVLMAAAKVYSLAWIQALFAACVAAGAWLGSQWGIPGVALGVGVAIVVQSILLLELSLRVTGVSRGMALRTLIRPAALALTSGAVSRLLVEFLRSMTPAPALVVAGTLAALGLLAAIAIWVAPGLVLGDDALAALRQLPAFRSFEKKLRRFGKAAV